MLGYKAFSNGLINRFGQKFEVGNTYSTEGEISFGNKGNGIHFCKNLCDVFRYFDSAKGIEVAVVSTEDKDKDLVYYEDEYNGYYDMYACRNITINKILSREEIIKIIISSSKEEKLKFISTNIMSPNECDMFISLDNDINKAIKYYQFGDKDIYNREKGYSKSLKY